MAPMAPAGTSLATRQTSNSPLIGNSTREAIIVEAWGQGFNVGALVLVILLVLSNYRRRILLHKLILLELVLAVWHGIFIFFDDPVYGWVLSSTAAPLYISYTLHNVVLWLKIKPFLPRWGGRLFILSVLVVQPYWILESWANFQYFNLLGSELFETLRYLEPLMRDPWWIFTTVKLVLVIKQNYDYTLIALVRTSPRFGVLLFCLLLSIIFLICDVAFTATVSTQSGINPFWRLALVFKCASDAIFLDDFKSVLDHISESAMRRDGILPYKSTRGANAQGWRPESASRRESQVGRGATPSATRNKRAEEHTRNYSEGVVGPKSSAAKEGRADCSRREVLMGRRDPVGLGGPYGSDEDILSGQRAGTASPDYKWRDRLSLSASEHGEGSLPMVHLPVKIAHRGHNFDT